MAANQKFHRRFSYVEQQVKKAGRPWEEYDLAQLDAFWNKAKDLENT